MSAFIKFKQSNSADVKGNRIYVKTHDASNPITKNNAEHQVDVIPAPAPDTDGFTNIELNPLFPTLDGSYDFGVSALDDAMNASPMLTQGYTNISIDFVAPNPPTEGSVYFV